jgi:hypothetical protein
VAEESGANATLKDIDETRAAIVELLRSVDASKVADRPASGEWSPVENVRHLLFAERLHFRELIPPGQPFDPRGLAPHFMAELPVFKDVGSEPTTDLDEVLAAWDALHATVQASATDSTAWAEAAKGNLSHLRFHLGIIESLLKS